jgi:DNA polymerase I
VALEAPTDKKPIPTDSLRLPNIRKLFVPDKDYIICDCDLVGADAQVVAWEADDEELKDAFRKGTDVHAKNASAMFGEAYTKNPSLIRKQSKTAVHATNYLSSAKTLAENCGWTIREAESFQRRWFDLHPRIKAWHDRIRIDLATSRSARNAFGYRIIYFDRIDACLTKAVAWIPQSTVAEVCFRGALQVQAEHPWVEFLLQVHDSLVFQIPKTRIKDLPSVGHALRVRVPYDDPLVIPWGLALSAQSWGDVQKTAWEEPRLQD